MNTTALGAKKVLFISEAHENFYNEKLNMVTRLKGRGYFMKKGEKRGTLVYL